MQRYDAYDIESSPEGPFLSMDNMPKAWIDVLEERERHVSAEGWTPEHDDQYRNCELLRAAVCYAKEAYAWPNPGYPPPSWPWASDFWKPKDYRRDLIRAAALLLAEIERFDRKKANVPVSKG